LKDKSNYDDRVRFKNYNRNKEELQQSVLLQMEIEIPKYRVLSELKVLPNKVIKSQDAHEWLPKSICPTSVAECFEEINDETFLKRHARYELDEKKRKKWDMQMMRQQQECDRLKASQARRDTAAKEKRKMRSTSINPEHLGEIEYLIVTDTNDQN